MSHIMGISLRYSVVKLRPEQFVVVGVSYYGNCRVGSGRGKLEKSGKIRKCFPVIKKSGNIDY